MLKHTLIFTLLIHSMLSMPYLLQNPELYQNSPVQASTDSQIPMTEATGSVGDHHVEIKTSTKGKNYSALKNAYISWKGFGTGSHSAQTTQTPELVMIHSRSEPSREEFVMRAQNGLENLLKSKSASDPSPELKQAKKDLAESLSAVENITSSRIDELARQEKKEYVVLKDGLNRHSGYNGGEVVTFVVPTPSHKDVTNETKQVEHSAHQVQHTANQEMAHQTKQVEHNAHQLEHNANQVQHTVDHEVANQTKQVENNAHQLEHSANQA